MKSPRKKSSPKTHQKNKLSQNLKNQLREEFFGGNFDIEQIIGNFNQSNNLIKHQTDGKTTRNTYSNALYYTQSIYTNRKSNLQKSYRSRDKSQKRINPIYPPKSLVEMPGKQIEKNQREISQKFERKKLILDRNRKLINQLKSLHI